MSGKTAPIIDIELKSFNSDGSTGGTSVNIYELEIAAIKQINILNNQISNYMKNPSDDQLEIIKKHNIFKNFLIVRNEISQSSVVYYRNNTNTANVCSGLVKNFLNTVPLVIR